MSQAADHPLNVMREARAFGKTLAGVRVMTRDGHIYIETDGANEAKKTALLAAKRALVGYLLGVFPGRKLLHETQRGFKVWHWTYEHSGKSGGYRVGIRIKLTPDEEHELGRGMWYGKQKD